MKYSRFWVNECKYAKQKCLQFSTEKKNVGSWRNKIILWGSSLVDVNK